MLFRKLSLRRTPQLVNFGPAATFAAAALTLSSHSFAENFEFDIDPQQTEDTLLDIAETGDVQIVFSPATVESSQSPEVRGKRSVDSALDKSLETTDLVHEFKSDDFVVVKKENAPAAVPSPAAAESHAPVVMLAQLQQAAQNAEQQRSTGATAGSEDSDEGRDTVAEEIVVTGTRLQLEASQLAKQTIVLDEQQIADMGEITLERVLQRLPQNFGGLTSSSGVTENRDGPDGPIRPGGSRSFSGASTINLRAIGVDGRTEGTLVLVDGRRLISGGTQGGIQDISTIPLSRIERIEVVLDGASSIYGADAVGGVVNIITKKDASDVTVSLNYLDSTDFGQSEVIADVSGGTNWSSGNLSFGLSSRIQDQITGESVGWQSGLDDLSYVYQTGEVVANSNLASAIMPNVAIGAAEDGNWLEQVSGGATPGADDFASPNSNLRNDDFVDQSVLPEITQYNADLSIRQELSPNVTFSSRAYYATRETVTNRGYFSFVQTLQAADPRNPLGETITYYGIYPGLGLPSTTSDKDSYGLTADIEWQLSDSWGLRFGVGHDIEDDRVSSANTLASVGLGSETAFNPWGDGSANLTTPSTQMWLSDPDDPDSTLTTGSVYDYLRREGDPFTDSEHDQTLVNLELRGSLFDLPAGAINTVIGAQWREKNHSVVTRSVASSSQSGTVGGLWRDVDTEETYQALFAEAHIPLFGDANARRGLQQLDFTASVRYEESDSEGVGVVVGGLPDADVLSSNSYSETTWSAGLVWSPDETLRFRTNFNTSFQAPFTDFLYTPSLATDCRQFFPPISTILGSPSPGLCLKPFLSVVGLLLSGQRGPQFFQENPWSQVRGGNPELDPMRSESWSVSADMYVTDDLTISATWRRTDFEDRPVSLLATLEEIGPDRAPELIPDVLTFHPNGDIATVDARFVNLQSAITESLDLGADYRLGTDFGDFGFRLNVSIELKNTEFLGGSSNLPERELIETRIPRHNAQLGFNWSRNNWYAAADTIYRGRVYEPEYFSWDPSTDIPLETGIANEPFTQTNAQVTYRFSQPDGLLSGMRLSAGINNLFDQRPKRAFYFAGDKVATLTSSTSLGNSPRPQSFFVKISKTFE